MFGQWEDPLEASCPKPSRAVMQWASTRSVAWSTDQILASGDAPADVLAFCREMAEWKRKWEAAAKDRPWEHGWDTGEVRFFGGPWIDREVFLVYLGYDAASARFGDTQWVEQLATYGDLARAGRVDDCRRVAAAMYEYIDMRERAQRLLVGTLRDARLAMEAAK